MGKKIKLYNIEIERLEKSESGDKIRCYYSCGDREGYFHLPKDHENLSDFIPGKEYIGEFIVSGEKNLVESDEEKEYIGEKNSELERILDENGNIFYSKKG